MKKIKLFSMLAATLFCGGTLTAQTLPTGTFSVTTDETELAQLSFGTSADGTSEVLYAISGNYVVFSAYDLRQSSSISWHAEANSGTSGREWTAEAPFQGSSYYHNAETSKCVTAKAETGKDREYCYRFTNALSVKVCGAPSSSKPLVLNVYEIENGTSIATPTATLTATTASSEIPNLDATKEYLLSITTTAESNVDIYEIAFEANVTNPYLSILPSNINLKLTPFAQTATESITIKGANLADGTYDLIVPTVEGLSVEPANVTVTNGALNETITLTYTSDADVEEGTAEMALTIGELTEKLAITYSAQVTLLEQTSVGEATTWNWANAGATAIQLTEDTKPSKNDTIVLANADIANDATFNSQALLVCGEYLIRDSKYFQGGYISFIAEKEGKIVVEFSNTGNRSDANTETRYLYVNGEKTAFGSLVTSENTTSEAIDVAAGTVEITFMLPDEEKGNQYCRVYSITYTPNEEGTGLVESAVETPATKIIRNGQLLIIRDGQIYNAQGAVVR